MRSSISKKVGQKLTVVSLKGKEATITLLAAGDFVGEESTGAIAGCRLATATALAACDVLKIERTEMMRVIHEEPSSQSCSWPSF